MDSCANISVILPREALTFRVSMYFVAADLAFYIALSSSLITFSWCLFVGLSPSTN